MRKPVLAAGLLVTGLSLSGCYGDRPGHWGDRHHRHHHHDRDHHHGDHDRGDWR
jgi:hypothetical protein